jgi:aminoglycoside phosphotransferase (APT) family kinase protein
VLTRALAARLLRRDLGGAWRIASGAGSLGNTRRAVRGDLSVVVKLGSPASALRRLAELEVTPPVVAWGEEDGSPYTVQVLAAGEQPEAAWFAAHVLELAELVRRYQRDERLAQLLRDDPSRDRLDVAGAASMFDWIPPRHGSPMWTDEVLEARAAWRRLAADLATIPAVPVHADPHGGNYVAADGRLFLIDWDEVDLSDPWRDAGIQLWWHVPGPRWADFVAVLGATLDDTLASRIHWWAGFKALRNGYWVDLRGEARLAELNARGFVRIMARYRAA